MESKKRSWGKSVQGMSPQKNTNIYRILCHGKINLLYEVGRSYLGHFFPNFILLLDFKLLDFYGHEGRRLRRATIVWSQLLKTQ
jgi:hypothetical protein